jgi:hypothetical protein
VIDPQGVAFGCDPVENAVGYQLLLGSDPDRVMDYNVVSDTPHPPAQILSTLPQEHTWWTVRAYDQFGSRIHADPRLIRLPENRAPVAAAGSNQVIYAGLNGMATCILDASRSTDPDGDALGFTWVWAVEGRSYLSNAASLTIALPIGMHTAQLMVHDGENYSQRAEVKIQVVPPLQCELQLLPAEINLRSKRPHVLACIRLPRGFTRAEADANEPLQIYPAGPQSTRRWTAGGNANRLTIYGFFDKADITDLLQNGSADLTVVGTLRSGQVFYARDTVRVMGRGEK